MTPDPPTKQLLAAQAVRRVLNASLSTAEKAIDAGLLGSRYVIGTTTAVEAQRVHELAQRPTRPLAAMPPALVVQVGGPQPDSNDPEGWPNPRTWRGWSAYAAADERRDAWTRWWDVKDPEAVVGSEIVALVGPWPVERARITAVAHQPGLGASFAVEDMELGGWSGVRIAGDDLGGGAVKRHDRTA